MADGGGFTARRRFLSAGVPQRVALVALGVAWLLAVGWLILPQFVVSQETRDARDVFCLQPDERAALTDAAVALGIARPESTPEEVLVGDESVSVFDWRDDHHDDFVRACDALSAVRGKVAAASGGAGNIVSPLLTVVLTSALTYATTRRERRTTRGETDAGELRTAVTAYNSAANRFLDSRVAFPADLPSTEMDAARDALVGRLNGVAERKPDWLAVREVVALLRDGELGPSLDQVLRGLRDAGTRRQKLTELRATVTAVSDIGFLVADALAEHGGADRRLTRPIAEGAGT